MIIQGDCLIKLRELEDNSIDSIVTDPPYELGFMGKKWDNTGIAYNVEMWKECLRVLKPGGHLLSFGGTRTYHRMAVAIEDAGFEIRDMVEWVYGSGFPKSLNIGKAVDKLQGNVIEVVGTDRSGSSSRAYQSEEQTTAGEYKIDKGTSEWEGWGTALKPAHEPICMARKPLSEKTVAENCLKWGVGGINIGESRISGEYKWRASKSKVKGDIFKEGSFGEKSPLGRFPANLIHDNSEEVRECFPESKSQSGGNRGKSQIWGGTTGEQERNGFDDSGNASRFFKSIIYTAKASKAERNKGLEGFEEKVGVGNFMADAKWINDSRHKDGGYLAAPSKPQTNHHPTVKPISLMRYLAKLITPPNGVVLDPFMGSGTTGIACKLEGFNFIGIELESDYIKIAEARIKAYKQQLKI